MFIEFVVFFESIVFIEFNPTNPVTQWTQVTQ